jgi:hypothetical protein
MSSKYMFAGVAALVALTLTVVPAEARQRRGGEGRGGGVQVFAHASAPQQRAVPRAVQPRAFAPRPFFSGRQPRAYVQQPRPFVRQPRSSVQQPGVFGEHAVPRQGVAPRAYYRPYNDRHGTIGRAPYGGPGYRGVPGYPSYVVPRGTYGHQYGYGYRPYFYSHPYYAFRPRVSLGFGLWIGFPVLYPFYSYGYLDPTYGYPLSAFGLEPGVAYGGVSFEVDPSNADVYVDGEYVGIASDFGPNAQPLTLSAGTHHVELQAADCAPVDWDVNVIAGQVIPLQGTMQRY